jgi:DNA recombination protein RmuC
MLVLVVAVIAVVVVALVVGAAAVVVQRGVRLDVRGQTIGRQLGTVGDELHRVTELVASLRRERAEQHGQLVAGLTQAAHATGQLAATAGQLRDALASPKTRGQWGERMADDVLRAAGFIEGVNFRKQTAIAGGTIPDFTFLLPQGRVLHMDVKFPVDNYLRFLESVDDDGRARCCTAFLRDVRARVKELTGRGYDDPGTTPGWVLLFIPNESVYGFIHEHDPTLADVALRARVVLCSPFTLFAVLGVVRQAVDSFSLVQASDDILAAMAGFSAQWQKFSEHIDLVGARLGTAQKAFDELAGPRRRQLERRLVAIDALRGDQVSSLREVNAAG